MKAPRKKLSLPVASGAGQSAPPAARSENRKAFVRAGQQAGGCGHKPFCNFFWCARNVPFQPLCSPRALRAGLIAQGIGANPGIVQVGYGRQCSCIEGISGGTLPPRLAGFCGQGTCIRSKASGGFHVQCFRYGTQAQAGFCRRASCFRARAAGPAKKGYVARGPHSGAQPKRQQTRRGSRFASRLRKRPFAGRGGNEVKRPSFIPPASWKALPAAPFRACTRRAAKGHGHAQDNTFFAFPAGLPRLCGPCRYSNAHSFVSYPCTNQRRLVRPRAATVWPSASSRCLWACTPPGYLGFSSPPAFRVRQ